MTIVDPLLQQPGGAWLRAIPKIRQFLLRDHHATFERADMTKQSDAWFAAAYDKWGLCMDAHCRATGGIFEWSHYYGWKHRQGHLDKVGDWRYTAFHDAQQSG